MVSWGRPGSEEKMLSRRVSPSYLVLVSASETEERRGGPTPRRPLSLLVVAFVPGAETVTVIVVVVFVVGRGGDGSQVQDAIKKID